MMMTTKNVRNSQLGGRPMGNGSVTVSQGTRSRLFLHDAYGNPYEVTGLDIGSTFEPSQNIRTNGNNPVISTVRLQPTRGIPDISSTLNPKRVSVATSTFWEGHPDMAHLLSNMGTEHLRPRTEDSEQPKRPKSSSLWGIGSVMESWGWGDPPALKKGILLQQKEHFLSRWKERYCILTRDYLHCFRRTTSIHRSGVRLSEMGNFLFKLRLAEMDDIQLEKRRIGTVISIILPNEPKILFKVLGDDDDATQQWFTLLTECLYTSKERRLALRTLHSSGTDALRNPATPNRHSLSEGSPTSTTTSSSSNSDTEKGDSQNHTYAEPDLGAATEKVTLRRDVVVGKKTNVRNFIAQETNRHSLAISEDLSLTMVGDETRSRRPESWTSQHPLIYKTPSLVPSASWLSGNQRRSVAGPTTTHAVPTFSRATQNQYSTSKHTSEITFRKMS